MTDPCRERFHLAHLLTATLLALPACSDAPAATSDPGGGGAATASGGSGPGGGGAGGVGGGVDPYVEAVKAASWEQLPAAPSVSGGPKQDDVFFLDADRGFLASGPTWSVHATTDGGASWTSLIEQQGTFFRALLFTDAMHGFAGNLGAGLVSQIDDPNVIYETADGGASWSPVTAIAGPAPQGICNFTAVDDMNLFAVGRANGPSHLVTTSDGGATWSSIDLSPWLSMAIDAHFTSPSEGIVAGMGPNSVCTVIRTTDGGASFEPVLSATASGSLCWKLDFPSAQVGYVAIQQTTTGPGAFAKTTDGGVTWQELPLPVDTAYSAIGVGFITEEIGWMVGDDPSLPSLRTFDGGLTWEDEPVLVGPINRFRFPDATTAYAVGASVYKLTVELP